LSDLTNIEPLPPGTDRPGVEIAVPDTVSPSLGPIFKRINLRSA